MKDEFHIEGVSDEGLVGVRKNAEGEQEATLMPAAEGQPIPPDSEFVQAVPSDTPGVLKVTSIYKHQGPARVSSKRYRDGFERTFGRRRADDKELN